MDNIDSVDKLATPKSVIDWLTWNKRDYIDRIDEHWDNVQDLDWMDEANEKELHERAGAHIGYYIEWLMTQGMVLETEKVNQPLMVV